jgi:hypothetical protein
MPSTNFPKGLSLTTTVHTVDGHLLATTGSISGTLTVGSIALPTFGNFAGGIETVVVTSLGTAHDTVISAPFTGFIGGVSLMGITSARAIDVTVYSGSATDGAVLVACVGSVAAAYSSVTTAGTTAAAITWGTPICITQAAAGSDGTARISISFVKQ